jgi:neutral ceramidase
METGYRAGFGSVDITCYDPQLNLFGWGQDGHVPSAGVTLPLRARAFVLEDRATRRRLAVVVADLGCISEALRLAVVDAVCGESSGLTAHDLLLTATHTHSGPAGFSTYLLYALAAPGVSPRVHAELVAGIVSAVREALRALRPAEVFVHAAPIPLVEPVAFNRSLAAYNRNPDVTPVTAERADEALSRTMTVLRVDALEGPPLGLVSFFAVHGTSVHSDQRVVHGDNKGRAAEDCEAWALGAGHPGFVALFAQEAAGDVSPNYRPDARRGFTVGRHDDDDESARWNGGVQSRHARGLWARAREEGSPVTGPLDAALRYRDFHAADPESGAPVRPRLGLAFALGTAEGPGPLRGAGPLLAAASRLQAQRARRAQPSSWRAAQGSKLPLWDLAGGEQTRTLGLLGPQGALLGRFGGRQGRYYQAALDYPFARERSWVPRYLPLQVLRFGTLVVGSLPHEATTVAGRRLRRALEETWGPGTRAVLAPYSNAYCGYLTTPEEYDEQAFEGAATLHGRGSLRFVQASLVELSRALRMGAGRSSVGLEPRPLPWSACLLAPHCTPSHLPEP